MDDQIERPPISDAEVGVLYTLARKAGIYRTALAQQDLPDDLTDRIVADVLRALSRHSAPVFLT